MDKNIIAVLNAAIDLAENNDPNNELVEIVFNRLYGKTYLKEVIATSAHFGIDPRFVKSTAQNKTCVKARRFICYFLNERDFSSTHIGEVINRDHSTVLYNLKVIEKDIDRYADVSETIASIRKLMDKK